MNEKERKEKNLIYGPIYMSKDKDNKKITLRYSFDNIVIYTKSPYPLFLGFFFPFGSSKSYTKIRKGGREPL